MKSLWLLIFLLSCQASETELDPIIVLDFGTDSSNIVVISDAGNQDVDVDEFDVDTFDSSTDLENACAVNTVPILIKAFGTSLRYYVEIEFNGERKALQFDTGSSISFIFQPTSEPDYTKNFGEMKIGCKTIDIAGRGLGLRPEKIADLDVIGLLGADFLLGSPTRLDISQRKIVQFESLATADVDPTAIAIPFDNVLGHILVPLSLDDQNLRLMFDTGGETMHVGVEGKPGDEEVLVEDIEGNILSFYKGNANLKLAGIERNITILRAPRFPYFEQTIAALGGNLNGLLDPSVFENETLVFDNDSSQMFLEK